MVFRKQKNGFTIVELLIVIVIIGILAAIITVAYNGIQNRAQQSVVLSDLRANSKKLQSYAATNGVAATPNEVLTTSDAAIKLTSGGIYTLASYCSAGDNFTIAAQITSGDKFYIQNGREVVKDNTINVGAICNTLNVKKADGSAADTTYVGVASTACASEGGTCSFSGTRGVIYGANGKFASKSNIQGSISCSNTEFGDPYPGIAKMCYTTNY